MLYTKLKPWKHSTSVVVLLFVLTCAWNPLAAQSKKDAENMAPSISDAEVQSQLSSREILQWERGLSLVKEGNSLIKSGEWLMNQKPSAFQQDPNALQQKKAEGKRNIEQGQKLIAQGEAILNSFRKQASTRKQTTTSNKKEQSYDFNLTASSLDSALEASARTVLFELWKLGYKKIYFGGFFGLVSQNYEPLESINEEVLSKLIQIDGNRYTLVPDTNSTFTLNAENDLPIIDFPNRATILRNFKSALIVGEIIYDAQNKRSMLSLRGIDLASMHVSSAEIALLTLDNKLVETLGLAETNDETENEQSFSIDFTDRNNFLGQIAKASQEYVFRLEFVGDSNGFGARSASMISKKLFSRTQTKCTDYDFISRTFTPAADMGDMNPMASANAVWVITPLDSGLGGRNSFDVAGRSVRNGKESPDIPVGLLQTLHTVAQEETKGAEKS